MAVGSDWRTCKEHQEYGPDSLERFCKNCGDFRYPIKSDRKKYLPLIVLGALVSLAFGVITTADEIRNRFEQKIEENYVRVSWVSREEQLKILDDNHNWRIDAAETENGITYMGNFYVPK